MTEELAYKQIIDRNLDWELVEQRLSSYRHINAAYPLDFLRTCSAVPPYYCHYVSWRLGTWAGEGAIQVFDTLLAFGASLPNWREKKSLLNSCDFGDFWGLTWELQVAYFFREAKADVEWLSSGPDLRIAIEGAPVYVECYTYRKSFGLESFVEELFYSLHPSIKVMHKPYLRFSLAGNQTAAIEHFLDQLFAPYVDPKFLETMVLQAQVEYPVLLPTPTGLENFYVYVQGEDTSLYDPGKILNAAGDPELYLQHAISEALNAKRQRNALLKHRPNLLAINFALSDYASAARRQSYIGQDLPKPELGAELDGVLLAVCGIDELSLREARLIADHDHPAAACVKRMVGENAT